MTRWLGFALMLIAAGCANRTFMDVGHGTGVPVSHVKQRAREQGISVQEAAQQIGDEMALREARAARITEAEQESQ